MNSNDTTPVEAASASVVMPDVHTALFRPPFYRGHLDVVSGTLVYGWCIRATEPGSTCRLNVLLGGYLIGSVSTGLSRPDVSEAFEHDMTPGFSFDLSDNGDFDADHVCAIIKKLLASDNPEPRGVDIQIAGENLILNRTNPAESIQSWLRDVLWTLERQERSNPSPRPKTEILSGDRKADQTTEIAIVLGVHRSGTSLFTAGLQALGLDLGDYDQNEDVHNKRGYFEHPEIRAFNERLMAHLGTTWENWGFYPGQESFQDPALGSWRHDAASLLIECFPKPGRYALKEPRMSTLWPFWKTVLNDLGWEKRQILVVRNPEEVAESNHQRGMRAGRGFPFISEPEPMRALWAVTMHGLLSNLKDCQTLLVRHASLYSDPVAVMNACADFIGVVPDATALKKFSCEFVDETMRRATTTVSTDRGAWGILAQNLYEAFGPETLPKTLSTADISEILLSQQDLTAQLPYLDAIRDSISCLHSLLEQPTAVK